MDRNAVLAQLVERGLVVIAAGQQEFAGKTCRVLDRGGRIVVEMHTVIADRGTMMFKNKRVLFAEREFGMDYDQLTPEQQEVVDGMIVGYKLEPVE